MLNYNELNKMEKALEDLKRAIKIVRNQSKKFKINPDKIGVLGFSAGGNLCARVSTSLIINCPNQISLFLFILHI